MVGELRIGLSQRILFHKQRQYDSLELSWYNFLSKHTVIQVQNRLDQNFEQLANSLDALILTGGNDHCVRKIVEMKLASCMMLQNKPILGICHGAFLLTDILGGKIGYSIDHMDVDHEVEYGGNKKIVNSYHTNIIKFPHSTAKPLAFDADFNCESWIDGNLAAIVWHPERMETPFVPKEIVDLIRF